MTIVASSARPDDTLLTRLADWLVVVIAIVLPWSTSATEICIVAWLLALLPTLDLASIRREVESAAGGPKVIAIAVAGALGIIAPNAFLSRRRGRLAAEYRVVFPDVLDLLLVCVDAGLGLEAALDRITGEITKRSRNFGINLAVMGAEMRAGRSFVDALESMADRLIIPEARSLSRCCGNRASSAATSPTRCAFSAMRCATNACCGRKNRPIN